MCSAALLNVIAFNIALQIVSTCNIGLLRTGARNVAPLIIAACNNVMLFHHLSKLRAQQYITAE